MRFRRSLIVLLGSAALAVAPLLYAQVVTANLQGSVHDATGAVVPGASVKAVNLDSGATRETTTDDRGLYRFNLLPRGRYEVQASKSGYAKGASGRVDLSVGETATLDLALVLAGRSESVTVTASAVALELASSQVQSPVGRAQIENLPINDRNFQQLANLIPGAAPSGSYDPTKRLYGGVVASGGTARSSGISIDGGNFNDNIVGGPVGLVPEDAIQEFQVITNQFSAEYGHSSGPFINVVTKSGTNDAHGSVFGLFRNQSLQSKGHFEEQKPDFSRQQFGGSFGGPIVRDRTFGFFALERNRQEKTQTVTTQGVFPQYEGAFDAPFRDLMLVARIDHRVNAAHSLVFRGAFQRNTSREGLRVDPNIAIGGPPTESAFQVAMNEDISWQASHTWVVSSKTVNQLSVHFNRFINNLNPTSTGINLRFPSVVIGQNASTPQGVQQDRLQVRNDFSTILEARGTHNVKVGVDWNPRIKYNGLFDLFKGGVFVFDQDDPSLVCTSPTSCTTRVAPIFALKGLGSTREEGTTVWQAAVYVQDDWRPTRKLTLNLGLRYEYESGFVNAGYAHPLEGQAPFFQSRARTNYGKAFGPRLGFAYDVSGKGKTVVRGGYGLYYDSTPWEISYIDRTFNGVKYLFGFFTPERADLRDPAFAAEQVPGGFAIDGPVTQPHTHQLSFGLGHELPYGIVLDTAFVHVKGRNGWMTRELNPGGARYPGLGLFSSFQTTNETTYNGLLVSARKDLVDRLQFQVSYTLSKATNLADDIFEPGVPQDSDNLLAEKGPSLRDARHRLVVSGIVGLPFGLQASAISAYQSGRPYNITTGTDDNADGHLKDRPAGTGRNAGRAAATFVTDVRLSRPIKIGKEAQLLPTLDLFNVFNRANFDPESYIGALNAGCSDGPPACGTLTRPGSAFGQPTDVGSPPRQLQLGLRLVF
jgi:outer membrane receptor protein involved in Fe transport